MQSGHTSTKDWQIHESLREQCTWAPHSPLEKLWRRTWDRQWICKGRPHCQILLSPLSLHDKACYINLLYLSRTMFQLLNKVTASSLHEPSKILISFSFQVHAVKMRLHQVQSRLVEHIFLVRVIDAICNLESNLSLPTDWHQPCAEIQTKWQQLSHANLRRLGAPHLIFRHDRLESHVKCVQRKFGIHAGKVQQSAHAHEF